jgi:hypothetical protein
MTDERPMTNPGAAEPSETTDAMALIEKASALFAYQHPQLVGPALADLMAKWLAGHVVLGNPKATRKVRQRVLEIQLRAIWQFVNLIDKMATEPAAGETRQ